MKSIKDYPLHYQWKKDYFLLKAARFFFFDKLSLALRSGRFQSALCALAHAMRLPCVREKNLSVAPHVLPSLPHSHLARRVWSTGGNTLTALSATGPPCVRPFMCHLQWFWSCCEGGRGWVTPPAAPASHRPQQDRATSCPSRFVILLLPICVAGVHKKPRWSFLQVHF